MATGGAFHRLFPTIRNSHILCAYDILAPLAAEESIPGAVREQAIQLAIAPEYYDHSLKK
ncbi:MAG: hypothetical protein IPL01_20720 [Acidobacteria bacterium]|nr:hypothetical protein [Acidobacteriota bacterium]MBK9708160.1 hypothetical protein [Acidobacteriota bacterium]